MPGQPLARTPALSPISPPTSPVSSRKFPYLPILVAVFVLLFGSTAYLGYQNWQLRQEIASLKTQPTPAASPTPFPAEASAREGTANWKTYTNEGYQISFNYPSGDITLKEEVVSTPPMLQLTLSNNQSRLFTLSARENSNPTMIMDTSEKDVILNNRSWKMHYSSNKPYDQITLTSLEKSIAALVLSGYQYDYVVRFPTDRQNAETLLLLDQILSTFKFTDQALTSDSAWKTYANAQLGFSFDYPSDYKVESRDPTGFIVITTPEENVALGGISIEARLQPPYNTWDNAIAYIKTSFTVSDTHTINGWTIYAAVGRERELTGQKFLIALSPYKTGAIAIVTLSHVPSLYTQIFDQILQTFKFIN